MQGIDRLHDAALEAGVLVCAGASTVPALTGAVVRRGLKAGPVERVAFGIMPGNDASRGPALVATIHGGVGKPIADQPGRRVWGTLRRMRLPGLGRRWVAPCDLPEPALFARRFAIHDTFAGAGLEVSLFHVGLWSLSWLVRLGLVRTLTPAAPLLAGIADRVRFLGTDRGGLRLELQAGSTSRAWCLIAEGGDGPFIPATPAAALVRKIAGGLSTRGAMPCLGLLNLNEIAAEWRRASLQIAAGWSDTDLRPSLYRRVLGAAYDRQSRVGQALHDAGPSHWKGRCTVTGAQTLAWPVVGMAVQLPAATDDAPIASSSPLPARASCGRGVSAAGYALRQLSACAGRQVGSSSGSASWIWIFGCRSPTSVSRSRWSACAAAACVARALWPAIEATETEEEGRFHFDVQIGLPLVGRLVRYRGWLTSP